MVRFFDDEGRNTFEKTEYNLSFFKLLKELETFFNKTSNSVSQIKGFKRETIHDYPFEAIREGLVNALAHRDYTITGASITFYIYNDRIEITSPGRLVYPLKISELEENEPVHRNEAICNIFSKTTYMEHVGCGIKRMKDAMILHGLSEPEFIEIGESIKVIFRANTNHKGLNNRQKEFLTQKDKSEITIKEYMKMFDIVRNTATKDLNELTDKGMLKKIRKGNQFIYTK